MIIPNWYAYIILGVVAIGIIVAVAGLCLNLIREWRNR